MYQLEGKYCFRNEQYFSVYRGINQKKDGKLHQCANLNQPKKY